MKKYFYCIVFLAASLIVKAQSAFKAGAARVNITPSYGTLINGDFLPMFTKVIHDSLYAKALAFDNGQQRFVFIVVDCMAMDGDLINDAKRIIKMTLNLSAGQIMISSTHAHSCGAVVGGAACPADLNYRLAMPGRIASAAKEAFNNLQPATIAWGHIDVPKHVSCRRWFMKPGFPMISPFGDTDKVWMNPPKGSEFIDHAASPTDPQVSFLAVKNKNGKWIGLLANYSTHYVADIPESTISADYFGELHNRLKQKLNADENFVGIMSNGTSGDVNTFDFKLEKSYPDGPYQKTNLIANDIADSIVHALKTVKWQSNPAIKSANTELKAKGRIISPELLARCNNLVATTDFHSLNTTDKASEAIGRLYALEVVEIEEYKKAYYPMPLQAVKIGEGIIGTLPGEFFSETGLKLKKQTSTRYYFTIGLANAYEGYVPPAAQFKLGGYETWLCASSHLQVDTEEKIASALSNLIQSLK